MEKRYNKVGGEERAKALKKHLIEHILSVRYVMN